MGKKVVEPLTAWIRVKQMTHELPASENMLPKPEYGWGPDTMSDKKLLKQIPHFESFFHVVVLLAWQ